MNNIIKAFNVNNEDELIEFIETLNLSESDENNLFSMLSDDMSVDGIRYLTENLVKNVGIDSYKKLKEQFSKTPFKRMLKEDENSEGKLMNQIKHFLAYMDRRDIFQKMRDDYYDDELDEELDNDFEEMFNYLYKLSNEGYETAEDAITNLKTEYMLLNSSAGPFEVRNAFIELDTEAALSCAYYAYKSLDEIYSLYVNYYNDGIKTKNIEKPDNDGEDGYLEENEEEYMKNSYGFKNEPIFDIGDNVKFEWNNKEITGKVIEVKKIGSVEYYDVISYNTEKQRRETYVRVDPVSNKMEKITEGDL